MARVSTSGDACEVRCGSELLEQLAGGLELERTGLVVTEGGARLRDQLPAACDLVGHVELGPDALGVAEASERRRRVVLGECDRALSMLEDRLEHCALVLRRELA